MIETDISKHSTPLLYHRHMGPLLFEPYAKHVAERGSALRPRRILDTAVGTGIVNRAVNEALLEAEIVGTDINPTAVEFAAQHLSSDRVHFQQADAQDLPFEDASSDLVLCLFGIMFVRDKVRANAEACRVLRAGGQYILVTFDRLHLNPFRRRREKRSRACFGTTPGTWSEGHSVIRTAQPSHAISGQRVLRTSGLRRFSWESGCGDTSGAGNRARLTVPRREPTVGAICS